MQEIHSSNPPVVTGIMIQIILEHNTTEEFTSVWACFESTISVVVEHVPSIGIIMAFCLPLGTY